MNSSGFPSGTSCSVKQVWPGSKVNAVTPFSVSSRKRRPDSFRM